MFRTADGVDIHLTLATVALGALELVPCQSAAADWLRWLSPIRTARAHSTTMGATLATSAVLSLGVRDGGRLSIGALEPPPASYCSLRAVFAPVPAHESGPAADLSQGKTLRLQGTRKEPGGTDEPFNIETDELIGLHGPLRSGAGTPASFEFPGGASAGVLVSYREWFNGLNWDDPADMKRQVIANFRASTVAFVESDSPME